MIDIDNYKRAVKWLRRSIVELGNYPTNRPAKLGLLHSFEVTYNISEALLRELYASIDDEKDTMLISTRELIRCAADHGLVLSTPREWMHYGLVIEDVRKACLASGNESFDLCLDLLRKFTDELDAFAHNLELRGLALA